MLLELLSDFQISIPELGQISATTMPIVVLTSNNSRELTEALKRRCLYLWLDYPERRARDGDRPPARARARRDAGPPAGRDRPPWCAQLDLKKPPSIAESIDWARTLLLMGADDIDRETFEQSISIIVKHRTDIDLVAERVGVRLADPLRSRRLRPARRGWPRSCSPSARSCAARASRSGPRRSSTPSRRSSRCRGPTQDDFREALAATIAKSQEDRRVFELLFDRYFFRAAEAEAVERGLGEAASSATRAASGSTSTSCASRSAQAIVAGNDGEMRDLARLAIAAFGRRGEGSGVVGVDVQRIRRTLGLSAGHPAAGRGRRGAAADRPRAAEPLRAPPAARARARPDRAHRDACPPRGRSPSSTGRCRPARRRTSPPCTARWRR